MNVRLTRRELVAWLALVSGCGGTVLPAKAKLPAQVPSREPEPVSPYADAVDALFDVMLPGAREAGVDRVLEDEEFVRFAQSQGFLRPLPEPLLTALDDLGTTGRGLLNRALDARAQLEQPLARYRELDLATRERLAEAAFDDDATAPVMLAMRAAACVAWLGAVTSDAGLVEVGFPPFEDFGDRLAVSGWPRTTASGAVDDYTHNRAPAATAGDDLSAVLTPEGDLR
ncbi:MAG: hypothetical protein JNK82_11220 [Myxococcaceae bacterium]|nr:hypothetical protein [Myxococcaceae bacterium]